MLEDRGLPLGVDAERGHATSDSDAVLDPSDQCHDPPSLELPTHSFLAPTSRIVDGIDPGGRSKSPNLRKDSRDHLHWPKWKKTGIFIVIIFNAFITDYSVSTGATAILPQARQWHVTVTTMNHTTAGATAALAVGGLATVWLSICFGCLPALFWFSVLSSATAAWLAAATTFESYLVARILNGLSIVTTTASGLMWMKNVWPPHECSKVVNAWATVIVLSPYAGPLVMAAAIAGSTWRVGLWVYFGLVTFGLLCTVFLGDETLDIKYQPQRQMPFRRSRALRLIGVEQRRLGGTNKNFLQAGSQLFSVIIRPPVFLACFFYFFFFPWTIGINTTISAFLVPEYHFSYGGLAAIYVAPVTGAVSALIVGHFAFDMLSNAFIRYHRKGREPESRLIILWPILPLVIVSHNLMGITLHHHWSYWIFAVAWAVHTFCVVLSTSAVSMYLLEAYPEVAGECGAWLNFTRMMGGFVVVYTQIPWALSVGTQLEYGIQSGIMAAAYLPILFLQLYGAHLRRRLEPLQLDGNNTDSGIVSPTI